MVFCDAPGGRAVAVAAADVENVGFVGVQFEPEERGNRVGEVGGGLFRGFVAPFPVAVVDLAAPDVAVDVVEALVVVCDFCGGLGFYRGDHLDGELNHEGTRISTIVFGRVIGRVERREMEPLMRSVSREILSRISRINENQLKMLRFAMDRFCFNDWCVMKIWIGLAVFVASGSITPAAEWGEFRGPERAGVWEQAGVVGSFEGEVLKPLWKTPIGAGYSGPTVAGGRVYVMDLVGDEERIVCLDAESGKELWAHAYECRYVDIGYPLGPRASVTVDGGRAYSLGAMGDFRCLDAESGKVVWEKDFAETYDVDLPVWGITCSPLVESGVVVMQIGAGRDGACVVGLEKKSGEEVWRAFDDKAGYVSPMVIEQAGKRVTVVWTGFRITGMDAATGKIYWEVAAKPNRMPINVPGPALDEKGELLFLSTFYDGSRMLKLSQDEVAAEEAWYRKGVSEKKTDALHCMISPPFVRGGHVYGVDSYGQLRCLDGGNGDRIWENIEVVREGRWSTVFMVQNGERTWMFTEEGDLIIAELSPAGYKEIDRARLIEPTTFLKARSAEVVWSQPAFAGKRVYARNDRELVCVDLSG